MTKQPDDELRASAAALLAAEPGLSRRDFVMRLHTSFMRIKDLGIKLPPKQSFSEAARKSRLSQRGTAWSVIK